MKKFKLVETLSVLWFKDQPKLLKIEVETLMANLLVLFCSLMSRSDSTLFCQDNELLLFDLSLFVQIQLNLFIISSCLME